MNKFLVLIIFSLVVPFAISRAQEVDILWQGDVYTPPFYEGGAHWTNEAEITILAIPHIPGPGGALLNPNTLVYKWWKNSVVLGTVNGVGKNSITFTGPIITRPQVIKVEILTTDGALLASATREFAPRPTKLLVYEDNPLYGMMFHKEVSSTYSMNSQEIKLVSYPLFFSSDSRDPGFLGYVWRTTAGSTEGSGTVTYRIPEGSSGTAKITLRASNENKILQSGEKSFTLKFENDR